MNELATTTSPAPLPVAPRAIMDIRTATMVDVPFLDAMQKRHGRALGYFPTKQFEGYIAMGGVLVAWASSPCSSAEMQDTGWKPVPLGYVISRDRYLKRDELGVIYQLCVAPGEQRKLIGAALVREVFVRSAYGCRLYCCWCAQDLAANHFWQSMGFVPIAFRAGSTGKKRVHIFWQRRINAGDATTPYWYPFQTNSGAIREDRIVFPIPPGVHWNEVRAVEVPSHRGLGILPEPDRATSRKRSGEGSREAGGDPKPRKAQPAAQPQAGKVAIIVGGKVKYVDRPGAKPAQPSPAPKPARAKREKPAKPKYDPKYLAAARELRDRYLERVNDPLALDGPRGKYDVSRALMLTRQASPLLMAG